MKIIKVAIVEDDIRFRKSLRRVIESKPGLTCVAEYGTGAEAIEHIPHDLPEVVLMDLNLPDCSGADVAAHLKSQLPDISVVILTVYNDADHIFKALRAGASGYLLKQATAGEILEAIADAHRGGAPMTSEIARLVVRSFREVPMTPSGTGQLSARELEILALLSEGLANKEIADRLKISFATVRTHLMHIYEKLHVRCRTEAAAKYLRSQPGQNLLPASGGS